MIISGLFSVMGPCLAHLARPSRSASNGQVQGVTKTPTTFRSAFYEAYKRQAKIFDEELKEYNKELNVALLFVSDLI
jgi:hypothetical protein